MKLSNDTIAKIEHGITTAYLPNKMPIKRGNPKIGTDTLIFNMSTAYNCPSAERGLCKVRNICYALRAEAQYNRSTPNYRERQRLYWKLRDAEDVFNDILTIIRRERIKTHYIRFNEAGDLEDIEDINKLKRLALLLKNCKSTEHIVIYGYTARHDLKKEIMEDKPNNLIINGSGFMLDNRFKPIDAGNKDLYDNICPGDCRDCNKCKIIAGNTVYVVKH